MEINNLKEGMVLKNYKELCHTLGIPVASGNTKIRQLKTLSEGVKYHKEGNKFVIDEVIKEVKLMDKRTLGNNNDISKNLRYMILDFLSKYNPSDDECIGFSKATLYKYCGMVNCNFTSAKGNRSAWAKNLNVPELAVEECLDYTDEKLSKTLRRSCSVLCNTNKAIGFRFGYNYIIREGSNELDTQVTADIETENIIRDIENKIMKEINIPRYDLIYSSGRWSDFKSRVIKQLKENYPIIFGNMRYYYNAIVFNYKLETVVRTLEGFKQTFGLSRTIARANVNKFFNTSLDKTINYRHKNGKAGEKNPVQAGYRCCNYYVSQQKEVKNSIIKQDYEQLSFGLDDIPF